MHHGNDRGFSLIELTVVVLIIGVLVALAVPVQAAFTSRSRDRSCQNNLRAIDGAAAEYQAEYGVWPPGVDALVTSAYLKRVPIDPHFGSTTYTIDAGGQAHANGPLDHTTYP